MERVEPKCVVVIVIQECETAGAGVV